MERVKTACFTGYRAEKLPWGDDNDSSEAKLLRLELINKIRFARERGVTHFIVGMADGADIMAAEIALGLREELGLTLECAVPFLTQSDCYSPKDKQRYVRIIDNADIKTVLADDYSAGCYEIRNKYMVDSSSLLIAVFDGKSGGTRNTVEYAKKNNVETIILPPIRV